MPKGPRREKRPADVVGAAVKVAKIAIGEETDVSDKPTGRRKSGLAGAKARNANLSSTKRRDIAKAAAAARWRAS